MTHEVNAKFLQPVHGCAFEKNYRVKPRKG
jgi:hypothetical protein